MALTKATQVHSYGIRTSPLSTAEDVLKQQSPILSMYGVVEGQDATLALIQAMADATSTTKCVLIDVNCQVDSVTIPSGVHLRIDDFKTVKQKSGASGHMFIGGNDTSVSGNGRYSRIRGQSATQTTLRCFSAVGVSDAGIRNLDIRDFKSYGAYFSSCEDTYVQSCTIRDITGGAVETAAGIYATNCKRHINEFNDVRDTGSNGIKFRADSLGMTVGCLSRGDRVYRAGFIGIANGTCKDHKVINAYCEGCVDNGLDMNGCYNTEFQNSTSVDCQDGFYLGENGITKCRIISCAATACRRAGVGSLGSLTQCYIIDVIIDNCGSGIYCSGFVGLIIRGGSVTNCTKRIFLDNETHTQKTSTGRGIDIQSNLSDCHYLTLHGMYFAGNEGYDVALGSSGIVGTMTFGDCIFQDSGGDGRFSYGGATLSGRNFSNSTGFLVSRMVSYTLTGDGATKDFTVSLPQEVKDTSYTAVVDNTDWHTESRILSITKTTTSVGLSFLTPPPAGSRVVTVRFDSLLPVG